MKRELSRLYKRREYLQRELQKQKDHFLTWHFYYTLEFINKVFADINRLIGQNQKEIDLINSPDTGTLK
jgi:hypothetical protein